MFVIIALFYFGLTLCGGYYYACALQLKNYRNREVLNNVDKSITIDVIAFIPSLALGVCSAFNVDLYYVFAVSGLLPPLIATVIKGVKFSKSKLKFTYRMKVVLAVYCLSEVLIAIFLTVVKRCFFGAAYGLSLPILMFSNWLTLPFFKRRNKKYLDACKDKLKKIRPLIVAVTGSAGKTSVKNMLSVLLGKEGEVFQTPLSYNTPLGISRAVESMKEDVKIFVVEFGARRCGDIKELCDLVKPDVGVLTCIAPQHIETFGSLENVAKEKTTLLKYASKSFGSALLEEYKENIPPKCELVDKNKIEIISLDVFGSEFRYELDGTVFDVKTSLLGSNNVYNLSLAILTAYRLGVSRELIMERIEKIRPIPHRLEGIDAANGVRVIDDGYNVNVRGAEDAVRLLSTYQGRKIVTTSGFVEQGADESEENKKFAEFLSRHADMIIVLGAKNKKALLEGAEGAKTYYAENLEACKKIYSEILKKGDVVLITANIPEEYCM